MRAWLVAYVVATSLAAFALCVVDKRRAKRRGPGAGRRVPERALLMLALAGGSPGLVLGMLVARHKTRKPSFIARLLVVLALQALAAWMALRSGWRP